MLSVAHLIHFDSQVSVLSLPQLGEVPPVTGLARLCFIVLNHSNRGTLTLPHMVVEFVWPSSTPATLCTNHLMPMPLHFVCLVIVGLVVIVGLTLCLPHWHARCNHTHCTTICTGKPSVYDSSMHNMTACKTQYHAQQGNPTTQQHTDLYVCHLKSLICSE